MSTWIGDKERKNGVELRPGEMPRVLDEAVLYIDGQCVMHMEAMNKSTYWFGLYLPDGTQVNLNIFSRSGRAVIDANAEKQ